MSVIDDVRDGAKAVLDGIPGIVQTYRSRPAALGALPCAFPDELRLDFLHTSGVRQWSGELDVYVVATSFDNEEAQQEADGLVSQIVDAFTDAPHFAGGNTVAEPVRIRSLSVDNGTGVTYPAWVITIGRFVYSEGR